MSNVGKSVLKVQLQRRTTCITGGTENLTFFFCAILETTTHCYVNTFQARGMLSGASAARFLYVTCAWWLMPGVDVAGMRCAAFCCGVSCKQLASASGALYSGTSCCSAEVKRTCMHRWSTIRTLLFSAPASACQPSLRRQLQRKVSHEQHLDPKNGFNHWQMSSNNTDN